MGLKVKKDRRNVDIFDGKILFLFVVVSICFVIYVRMKDFFGCNVRCDIEGFVFCFCLVNVYIVLSLILLGFCSI